MAYDVKTSPEPHRCTTERGFKHSPPMSPRGPESHTQPYTNWPNTMKHNDELVIVTVT